MSRLSHFSRLVLTLVTLMLVATGVMVGAQSAYADGASPSPATVSQSPTPKPPETCGPAVNHVMTYNEVAQLAKSVGVPDDQLAIAVAIAVGESALDPRCLTDRLDHRDLSYGLWQINMIGKLGPPRLIKYNLVSNDDLYDALTNAKIMYIMSNKGTDWKDWGAYRNGSYKRYLPHAEDAAWNVTHPDQPQRPDHKEGK